MHCASYYNWRNGSLRYFPRRRGALRAPDSIDAERLRTIARGWWALYGCACDFVGRHNVRRKGTAAQMASVATGIVGRRLMYRDLIAQGAERHADGSDVF